MANQREIKCPFCTGSMLSKTGGRVFASITGFLQRSFNIRIPTALLSYLKEKMPVSKSSALKGKCSACDGKGTLKDPSDDTAKIEQVKSIAQSKSKELLELESKLAPPCGNRYTIIQGCDLLEVGLGMNNAPSYRVDKEKSVRNKGLIDPGKVNTKKAGPQFPEGGKCNHVQGISSLASPGGHYMIKCSNKFTVLAGAQGIDITTGGPLTISGGITRFTAPEILLGTQTGRLSLQGDVVDISGRSIEVSPTDGHFFVKGTISNTGNLMVGGHMHAESLSFVKAECSGRNEMTKPSSNSDMYGGPAFWGGLGAEGIPAALKDTIGFVLSKATNPVEAQQMLSLRFIEGIRDKILNMTYLMRPYELTTTGYILPGTIISMVGVVPCLASSTGTTAGPIVGIVTSPVLLNNFPHVHALPDAMHTHEVRVPDLDYSADSAGEVRGKQGGVSASAPLHKQSTGALEAGIALFQSVGSIFVAAWKAIQGESGPFMK